MTVVQKMCIRDRLITLSHYSLLIRLGEMKEVLAGCNICAVFRSCCLTHKYVEEEDKTKESFTTDSKWEKIFL